MQGNKRPTLKPGDIVRLSRRGKARWQGRSYGRQTTNPFGSMVVISVAGDGSDGRSVVTVWGDDSRYGHTHTHKMKFTRRELWYTGTSLSAYKNPPTQKPRKAGEVECPVCKHNADKGCKCWWCGAQL